MQPEIRAMDPGLGQEPGHGGIQRQEQHRWGAFVTRCLELELEQERGWGG